MEDICKELSDVQFKAVSYMGGPELVLAGAGSGKTRVLTYKIAYLLQKGFDPCRIMALTFTNKAAREMKSRLVSLVGEQSVRKLLIGTFHSVFAKFLRKEISKGHVNLPYTKDFVIYDEKDCKNVIDDIIKSMMLPDSKYSVSYVMERISSAKNNMITPGFYGESKLYSEDKKNDVLEIGKIYKKYSEVLLQFNVMDFDDILLNTYNHFNENKDRRLLCSSYLDYCLVDEYQDTNLVQKSIILQLTGENNNLFVVGDDAQSIYRFRGAVVENILNFEEDYPSVKEFKLEENYRSSQTIVNAANSLIGKNLHQRRKIAFSNNAEGRKIVCVRSFDDKEEAKFIVTTMNEMVQEENYSYGDFAVLYRNNSLSRVIEKAILAYGIKYVIYGGVSFFQRKEVKDVFSFFRVLLNPGDDLSLERIINFPRRDIGDNTLAKLKEIARCNNMSLWSVIFNSMYYRLAIKRQRTRDNIAYFASQLDTWSSLISEDAYQLAERMLLESGIIDELKEADQKEKTSRLENVYQLLRDIKEFVDEKRQKDGSSLLSDYVSDRALFTDEDEKDKEAAENISVKLMTVHKSKGLEFPVVFVVGMDESIFPCQQVLEHLNDDPDGMEEERRLCYVAMTRAKNQLFFTGADNRFLNGISKELYVSRFVREVDGRYLNVIKSKRL